MEPKSLGPFSQADSRRSHLGRRIVGGAKKDADSRKGVAGTVSLPFWDFLRVAHLQNEVGTNLFSRHKFSHEKMLRFFCFDPLF